MREHPTDSQYCSITELAELLRISTRHLHRMMARGEGPRPMRLGRRLIFDLAAVRRWAKESLERARGGE
jgi:excisionase family DNA binding protein